MSLKKRLQRLAKNFKFLPPKQYISLQYNYLTGKKLDLKNPRSFNEKIQWYKLYYKNPLLKTLVDKYNVREFVKSKIGEKYLINLIGVYNNPNEIDFEKLPEKFVVKCVHGSGYNICVKDKSILNIEQTKNTLSKWQRRNFYAKGKEWAYKGIKPLIIVESFLEEINKEVINDYKFFCFDGKIKFIQVDLERKIKNYRCYFDTNWEKLNFNTKGKTQYEGTIEKPSQLEKMIQVVEKLACDFPFVRVDFYSISEGIFFGELTFYPGNGTVEFIPDEMNFIIGDYFKLPQLSTKWT